MLKKIIKEETPPNKDPKKNLNLEQVLFKIIEIPSNNIKSNKKLTKKT